VNEHYARVIGCKYLPNHSSFRNLSRHLINKESIIESLRTVLDPEIGISIVDLNMVRDVTIDGDTVKVKIALTVAHCPLAKTLQSDIENALKKSGHIRSVTVETTAMSKQELNELRTMLQNKTAKTTTEPRTTIGPGIERLGKREIRNIIAIVSGKGGVGKSFVTSMLACELRREGYEVGVLDADLTGPSIAKVFGVSDRPSKTSAGAINPIKTRTGIRVMSINLILDDPGMPVIWRGPIVNSVIRQLYWDVDWGPLHYLLVDLPPGTSDAPLTVFQSLPLDGVIVVSSPQHLASMIVTKAVNMAKKMNTELLGLIENMSYLQCPRCDEKIDVFGHSQGEKLAKDLGIQFLGSVPLDPKIAKKSDEGEIDDYSSPSFHAITDKLRLRISEHAQQLMQGLPIAWSIETAKT
jgi:ATP-binding protein involved in chromosome partitioning